MWAWFDFLSLSTWSVYDLTLCSNIPEQSACVILLSITWASCVWDPTFCYLSKLHVWSYCYLSKLCVWSYFVTWASCVCDPTFCYMSNVCVIQISVTWASCVCEPTFCYLSKPCVWSYFLLPEQAVCVILPSVTSASCLNDPKDYWLHEQVVSMIWLSISIPVSVYLSKLPAWFNAGIVHAWPEKVALCDLTVHLLPVQVWFVYFTCASCVRDLTVSRAAGRMAEASTWLVRSWSATISHTPHDLYSW